MRPLWKDVLIAIWLGMILPGIVLHIFVLQNRHNNAELAVETSVQTEYVATPRIPVRCTNGLVKDMESDYYLTGVVLAEMPAEFHPEALKAQSVAARTYAWKAFTTGGKHGDGSVCTDSACCQAYISQEDYLSRGGTSENLAKVYQAVQETSSFVLAYDGELIEATYFSSSGGHTEAAVAVWGADYPYLQVVTSPEENTVHTITYTVEEFRSRLGISLPGEPAQWFGSVTRTDGGGIAYMDICGVRFSGVQLRSLLNLRSTVFLIWADGEKVYITTQGYGHRVGMSQYGANAFAEMGKNWQEILQHYYPGTTLYPAY